MEGQLLPPVFHQPISLTIEDDDLWAAFEHVTNEMIVTKAGRRMFPAINVKMEGLEPATFYSILLEFKQIDENKWKYFNGTWSSAGKADPPPPYPIYIHPDSPNYGRHWTKDVISFAKVKLTNKASAKGHIQLNSLHKYEPRIHVVKIANGCVIDGQRQRIVKTFCLPPTRFIAVTAYQDEAVTALKIKHNPFAKAFQKKAVNKSNILPGGGLTPEEPLLLLENQGSAGPSETLLASPRVGHQQQDLHSTGSPSTVFISPNNFQRQHQQQQQQMQQQIRQQQTLLHQDPQQREYQQLQQHHQQLQQQQLQARPHQLRNSPYSPQQRLHPKNFFTTPPGLPIVTNDDPDLLFSSHVWGHGSSSSAESLSSSMGSPPSHGLMWNDYYQTSPDIPTRSFSSLVVSTSPGQFFQQPGRPVDTILLQSPSGSINFPNDQPSPEDRDSNSVQAASFMACDDLSPSFGADNFL